MTERRIEGEPRLVNVETKMNREQRLHMVEEHLKIKLSTKKVEYPGEKGVSNGYSRGVPDNMSTDDFVDIVLFCALITNNSDVQNFEFSNQTTSNMREDYNELRARTLELIKIANRQEGTEWLKRSGFMTDKDRLVHLSVINKAWGFNVIRGGLIELGWNWTVDSKMKRDHDKATASFVPRPGEKEIEGGINHRYFFSLFFPKLKELYKDESPEEQMVRAKKIIKAMVDANLGINENGDKIFKKYYPLCQMILDDVYGIKECTTAELVQKWREIEK